MEELSTKVQDDTFAPGEWNQFPREMERVINVAGQSFSALALNQLGIGISEYSAASSFYSCTGGALDYILTPTGSFQGPQAYVDGLTVRFRPNIANAAGTVRVNVNGLGLKEVHDFAGDPPDVGVLNTSRDMELRYDGTDFLMAEYTSQEFRQLTSGDLGGMHTTFQSDFVLSVDIGECTAEDSEATVIALQSQIRKTVNVTWAAGTGNGGTPSILLPLLNDTFYFVFMIHDTRSKAVDMGFDSSPTAANLLSASGYNKFRQIGSVMTTSSGGKIREYKQIGDEFQFIDPPPLDISADPGTAGTLVRMSCPAKACMVRFRITYEEDADPMIFFWLLPADPSRAPTEDDHTFMYEDRDTADRHCNYFFIMTNDSGEIYMERGGGAPDVFHVQTIGWWDNRQRSIFV